MRRSARASGHHSVPSHVARLGFLALVGVGGLGLVAALLAGLGQAHDWDVRLDPLPLVAAGGLAVLYWLLGAISWWATARRLGAPLSLPTALGVFFVGNLGRYVPGKVWFALGRTYLAHQRGAPPGIIATSVVLELALIAISGAVITTAGAPFLAISGVSPAWFGPGILVAGVIALHPRVLGRLLATVARVTGAPAPRTLSYSATLPLLAMYTGAWLVAGAALLATLAALAPVGWDVAPGVFAVWGVAFLAGFAAPFTPAGLGVREATGALVLATLVPLPTAAAAMILFRVILTAAEVACVLPHLPTLVRTMREPA